jgi:DNA-binding transcriptional MerR regulator
LKYLRTSDLARAVGIHPNTVRLYEEWGLLPPVERSPTGYRRFTQKHLDCLRLARTVYGPAYPGRALRRSGSEIIQSAVSDDWGGALEKAYRHLALVKAEQARADAAAALLERWAQGMAADATAELLNISAAAKRLGVSVDVLRNWERNGLIRIPRQPENGYRLYGPKEIGRLRVIRMLVQAGYSLMAILRMLLQLDQGQTTELRRSLDTPRPDEDVYAASDRWLSTLGSEEKRAGAVIELISQVIQSRKEDHETG